jgi:ankyrin repeat protein
MQKTDIKRSQRASSVLSTSIFAAFIALFWNSIVFGLILSSDAPLAFKAIFSLIGLGLACVTIKIWRDYFLGGEVKLNDDPVPHGIKTTANFELGKNVRAHTWCVEVKFQKQEKDSDGDLHYREHWRQTFPAQRLSERVVKADFIFPTDYSPKNLRSLNTQGKRTLTLKADKLSWEFLLEARDATSSELIFDAQDEASIGNNVPTLTLADIEKARKIPRRLAWVMGGIFIITAISQFSSFFDFNLISRAKAQVGLGAYSSQVSTDEFDVRVTNHLMNNWAFRGRLVGTGRVMNGELRVRVEGLDIQATNECKGDAKKCEVASVRLLLSQDGDGSFSTPAQSAPIEVNAQLQDVTRWSLPTDRIGTELVMQLPSSVDVDTMRLKLEIRTAANSTVYPDSGPYLTLHRALAKANGQQDPCEKLTSKLTLTRAGCSQQLLALHQKPLGLITSLATKTNQMWLSTRQYAAKLGLGNAPKADEETLNNLLLEAIQSENFATAQALLKMGASPNAEDSYQVGRTALGYAAATKNIELVDQLLQTGAKPDERKMNERGQVVTPLTQALRADAADTIEQLIKAGASVRTIDPQGWTPMHIAAYESSQLSIEVLVNAGADVNERTPAYRQQNVLQTAMQYGNFETARILLKLGADPLFKDNQGENACGWAKFFKRNEKIQALVCGPT